MRRIIRHVHPRTQRPPLVDERPELGLRLAGGDVGLEPPDEIQEVRAAVAPIGWIESERHPELRMNVVKIEPGRSDADDPALPALDLDLLADDRRISAERATPDRIRQHDD